MLVDWFTLIHEKHLLVRREAELVYTYVPEPHQSLCSLAHLAAVSLRFSHNLFPLDRAKQQNLEERQADVEYELRCLLNKPGV